MAVTGTLHKLVWGGKMAVDDGWSCGLHLLSPTPEAIPSAPVVTAIKAWFGQLTSSLNPAASLDWVKLNAIDPVTGKYIDQAHPRTDFVVPSVVGGGTLGPPQDTIALTTRTGNLRGLAHAGRFYPPTGFVAVDATGHVQAIAATSMLGTAKTLLLALTAAGGVPVVFSKKGQLTNPITSLSCGRVIDNQLRRRNALQELYVTVTVP